jgi:iron complex outermembrane recepter protein
MRLMTLGVASSLAIVACMASPAFAQDEDQQEGQRTNEIVVTAQFREQRLQDTPIAITAVNAEMLEARGQSDVSQVAAQAPNVTLKASGQDGGQGMVAFIRGVGQTDFNFALEPGVGIYLDDVYFATVSGSLLDLMDVDRVEVLRGPQGTLAGKNSIGGAIKLFSSKPDGTGRGSVQATYGSFNRIDVRGFADFGITDTLFARVAGVSKNRDGYVKRLDYGATHPGSNVVPSQGGIAELGTMGGTSLAGARLSLRWIPTDQLEINLAGDFTNDNSEAGVLVTRFANNAARDANGNPWLVGRDGTGIPFDCRFVPVSSIYGTSCDTPPAGYDPRYISYATFLDSKPPTSQMPFKPFSANPIQHMKSWGVHGNISYEIAPEFEIVSISAYRGWQQFFGQDSDGSPVPQQQLFNELTFDFWSQELRLNGEILDGLVDFTVGGFYSDQEGVFTARVDLPYAGIDFIHGPDTTPSTSKAVFFNSSIRPMPDLTITGGIRYSEDKKTYTYRRSNPDGTLPGVCEFFTTPFPVWVGAGRVPGPTSIGNSPNCLLVGLWEVTDTFEGNRLDWRAVADYRFSDQLLAYASVSTGYKGGGVNPRPFFGPSSGECSALPPGVIAPCNQLKAFNPETLTTYEIGFKADLLDRRLRLNGAGFFNKYEDIILSLSACPGAPCIQPNNVGAADVKGLELEILAYPVDGLSLDGSIALLDFEYTSLAPGVAVTPDMITPYTPEFTYSFGIQYDHETDLGTFGVRFDGSYQSEMFGSAVNAPSNFIESYFLANGRISWTSSDEDWNVGLEVQNLFDKYHVLTTFDQQAASGLIAVQPGMPRTWAVTVKRSFR